MSTFIYKFRAIDSPMKGMFGDSSANTKWSKTAGTVFVDKPTSIKACQRQMEMATWFDKNDQNNNWFKPVKCEIVKFELIEIT